MFLLPNSSIMEYVVLSQERTQKKVQQRAHSIHVVVPGKLQRIVGVCSHTDISSVRAVFERPKEESQHHPKLSYFSRRSDTGSLRACSFNPNRIMKSWSWAVVPVIIGCPSRSECASTLLCCTFSCSHSESKN